MSPEGSDRQARFTAAGTTLAATATTSEPFAAMREDRPVGLRPWLAAVGRARDLVRQFPRGDPTRTAHLGDLLTVLLTPYVGPGSRERVRVTVPELHVGRAFAMGMAVAVHGLAVNSIRFGSLSLPTGSVNIFCLADHHEVEITWREWGPRNVVSPAPCDGHPGPRIKNAMAARLGGIIESDWLSEGMVIVLRTSKARLAA